MGELVVLREWADGHARRLVGPDGRAESRSPQPEDATAPLPGAIQFIYDLSCPLSYLAAEQVEQSLGQVEWIPAISDGVEPDAVRPEAARRARALRVPLVWPEHYPAPALRASRAAAYAAAAGFGARFGLAALRLAFCGGFDLENPKILSEAAAAAGVGVRECLEAAENEQLDAHIYGTATSTYRACFNELPAFRIGRGVLGGRHALTQAAARLGAGAEALAALGGD